MKLTKGHTYNVSSLTCAGWTPAGADTTGYNAADYFTSAGEYLGADEDGIEPEFASDEQAILSIVAAAIERANADGDNWADYVDADLIAAGVETGERPDGNDAWEVCRLADGRMVYLSDESAKGAARYRIADTDPDYSAYTVQVSTEPGYYGSQCTDEDALRIAKSIRDLIQGEFPGITAELWTGPVNGCSGKTTGPDPEVCEEINEWCAENWTAAL